ASGGAPWAPGVRRGAARPRSLPPRRRSPRCPAPRRPPPAHAPTRPRSPTRASPTAGGAARRTPPRAPPRRGRCAPRRSAPRRTGDGGAAAPPDSEARSGPQVELLALLGHVDVGARSLPEQPAQGLRLLWLAVHDEDDARLRLETRHPVQDLALVGVRAETVE